MRLHHRRQLRAGSHGLGRQQPRLLLLLLPARALCQLPARVTQPQRRGAGVFRRLGCGCRPLNCLPLPRQLLLLLRPAFVLLLFPATLSSRLSAPIPVNAMCHTSQREGGRPREVSTTQYSAAVGEKRKKKKKKCQAANLPVVILFLKTKRLRGGAFKRLTS